MPLPDDLPPHFTVARALQSGVGYGRLRAADLTSPFHGIRSSRPAADGRPGEVIRASAEQYAPRLRPGQFFCESTALALLGLPVPGREPVDIIHVGVQPPLTPPRTKGVRGHQYAATVIGGRLPVCAPIEAWIQCARRMRLDDVVMIGDGLVRRERPFATLSELESAVSASQGSRGAVRLREARALVRAGTDSPMETLWRLLILRNGLPEPLVNARIEDERGRFLGLGDLVYPQWRIVIEYEGVHHFATGGQMHHDIDRLASFVDAGWTVIRIDKAHFAQPAVILSRIRRALVRAGWRE